MALIDPGIILQLLVTRVKARAALQTVVSVAYPGDPDPEQVAGSEKSFTRLKGLSIVPDKTERSNDEDADAARLAQGTISLSMPVIVPAAVARASFGAVGQACGIVAAMLAGVTLRDTATTHQVDFEMSPRVEIDLEPDEASELLVGVVMFSGTVMRTSGRDIASFVS